MYADYAPHRVPETVQQVVVLEGGESSDNVIAKAREIIAVSIDFDGNEIFWIVFPDDPKRAWDFTEQALRSELR